MYSGILLSWEKNCVLHYSPGAESRTVFSRLLLEQREKNSVFHCILGVERKTIISNPVRRIISPKTEPWGEKDRSSEWTGCNEYAPGRRRIIFCIRSLRDRLRNSWICSHSIQYNNPENLLARHYYQPNQQCDKNLETRKSLVHKKNWETKETIVCNLSRLGELNKQVEEDLILG